PKTPHPSSQPSDRNPRSYDPTLAPADRRPQPDCRAQSHRNPASSPTHHHRRAATAPPQPSWQPQPH
ncbi:hypothetical protein, partial [Kribbella turkmenica]|uniref:hypothetical protein n=1 Tax=Kribbella turkmenica TaxID=2530375 RepID=UPI001F2E7538